MKRRFLIFAMIFVLALSVFCVGVSAESSDFAGGSGTESDPYLIADQYQLDKVRNYLDAHFKLTADISFTYSDYQVGGAFYHNNMGFIPIGTPDAAFSGVFDGDGHKISGLRFNYDYDYDEDYAYYGVFGYLTGTVKNLTVGDGEASIKIAYSNYDGVYVGAVAGYCSGTIENCVNELPIFVKDSYGLKPYYVAGIAGYSSGTVTACKNKVQIEYYGSGSSTHSDVGGIVGECAGLVDSCENSGKIIVNSYRCSGATNVYAVGGIIGNATSESRLIKGVSSGNVSLATTLGVKVFGFAGGIVGDASCYISNAVYSGRVHASVSNNSENASYVYAGGIAGLASRSITNCTQVSAVVSAVGKTECTETSAYAGGIAGYANEQISNCASTYDVGAQCDGKAFCGGIVGYSTDKILNSSSKSDVSVRSNTVGYVGGIAGYVKANSSYDKIENSYSVSDIEYISDDVGADIYAGGIAGYSEGFAIQSVYSGGNVGEYYGNSKPDVWLGGLVGYMTDTALSDSFAIGDIISATSKECQLGGITGEQRGTSTAKRVYYIGDIVCESENCVYFTCFTDPSAAIKLTSNDADSDFTDCHYSSNKSTNWPGTYSHTLEQMKSAATFTGFDFENVWVIDGLYPYPQLREVPFVEVVDSYEFTAPTKTRYLINEEDIELSDCFFDVVYNSGRTERIAVTEDMVTGFDNTSLGTKTVSVTCLGATETFNVEIYHVCSFFSNYNDKRHWQECEICSAKKDYADHTYSDYCDTDCNGGCGYSRPDRHSYYGPCDDTCHWCGYVRIPPQQHDYEYPCSEICRTCNNFRETEHTYANACDNQCDVCGRMRATPDHVYDGDCDADCNVCALVRTPGEHQYGDYFYDGNAKLYEDGTKTATCAVCGATDTKTAYGTKLIFIKGWHFVDGKWYYCEDGDVVKNTWKKDSTGWCYLDDDGAMATNKWVKDSIGWCYVGSDGYAVTNCWKKDSVGWCYLNSEGSMVKNNWVKDGGKWYYLDGDGYMVSNGWRKDSKGWCYLGSDGAMVTNSWIRDSVGWCYVGSDGYCITNAWQKDSKGWCYLDSEGRMVTNAWVNDSHGRCWLDANGYWDGKYY